MEDRPQSLSNPEILTESEKKQRAELLKIQDDPRLSVREKLRRMREVGGRDVLRGRHADLYDRQARIR